MDTAQRFQLGAENTLVATGFLSGLNDDVRIYDGVVTP